MEILAEIRPGFYRFKNFDGNEDNVMFVTGSLEGVCGRAAILELAPYNKAHFEYPKLYAPSVFIVDTSEQDMSYVDDIAEEQIDAYIDAVMTCGCEFMFQKSHNEASVIWQKELVGAMEALKCSMKHREDVSRLSKEFPEVTEFDIDEMISRVDMKRFRALYATLTSSGDKIAFPSKKETYEILSRWAVSHYKQYILFNRSLKNEVTGGSVHVTNSNRGLVKEIIASLYPKYPKSALGLFSIHPLSFLPGCSLSTSRDNRWWNSPLNYQGDNLYDFIRRFFPKSERDALITELKEGIGTGDVKTIQTRSIDPCDIAECAMKLVEEYSADKTFDFNTFLNTENTFALASFVDCGLYNDTSGKIDLEKRAMAMWSLCYIDFETMAITSYFGNESGMKAELKNVFYQYEAILAKEFDIKDYFSVRRVVGSEIDPSLNPFGKLIDEKRVRVVTHVEHGAGLLDAANDNIPKAS